jgi:hypothetical protein
MTAQPPLAPLWRSTDPARRIKEDRRAAAEAAAERDATDQLPRGRYALAHGPARRSLHQRTPDGANPAAADRRRQRTRWRSVGFRSIAVQARPRRLPSPERSAITIAVRRRRALRRGVASTGATCDAPDIAASCRLPSVASTRW